MAIVRRRLQPGGVGPEPVEAIAAEADANLIRLGTILRLPTPDGEEAQDQALVGDTIEVIELAVRLQIGSPEVAAGGAGPERRLIAPRPLRTRDQIPRFPV